LHSACKHISSDIPHSFIFLHREELEVKVASACDCVRRLVQEGIEKHNESSNATDIIGNQHG